MISKISTRYLLGFITLTFVTVLCAFAGISDSGFNLAKQEILLRKIGHELLLQSGDSTSRVLPVKKLPGNEYQIRFENEFSFQVDSLVNTIRRSMAQDKLAQDYIVNVINCSEGDVIFGYAVLGTEKNDIIPCSGRHQLKSCYVIDIKFQSRDISIAQKGLIGGIPILAFVGLMIFRSNRRKNNSLLAIRSDQLIQIGSIFFDPKKRNLIIDQRIIELTSKESQILLIFTRSPNEIIERSRLQKEVWEDEGVIVGRSLDVFISKLRKKLENDPSVRLTNIHSKGYILEVS